MLALFAVIGIGYAIGQISVAGFSLGVGAVLFAGLALGAIAPAAAPPGLVSSIGLVMFLYGIGVQYGRQFFAGLRGAGLKWNLLAAVGVLASLAIALALGEMAGVSVASAMGLFAGALTSTPTLQAALDAAGNRDPAIGYSVAYPFGIIGPILCLFLFARLVPHRLTPAPARPESLEVTLHGTGGATVSELAARLPHGVSIAAIRVAGENRLPDPEMRLAEGDGVLLTGLPPALDEARRVVGRVDPGSLVSDRANLDMLRLYISSAAVVGTPVRQLKFPAGITGSIVEVRRGDAVLLPADDLVLEHGDRIGVIAPRAAFADLRRHFGDSMKSTAEFSYVSVGLGMSIGVLVGLATVPIPGIGAFSLGIAGGPLIVALVLGRLGRTGPLSWHIPLAANLTLRNFGLTLFLAAVGLGSGAPFVEAIATTGVTLLAIGAAIIVATIAAILLLGQYVLRLPTDDLFGVVSGATGNPAIVMYASRALSSDRVEIVYATVFPALTIVKILCVQIAIGVAGAG